jgi:hypothetical protein
LTRHSIRTVETVIGLVVVFALAGTTRAGAQPATSAADASSTAASAATAQDDDDDAKLRPLEPDFSIINVPTTLPLPLHKGNFHLTHRFNENLRSDGFSTDANNLFGLDTGATIQFEYRFAVFKHVEAIASRTNVDRDFQFSGKYDAMQQSSSRPVGLSVIVSVEGGNNFQERYTPAFGATVSRTFGNIVAAYVAPFLAHNTAAGTGITRETAYVGLGARLKIRPTVYVSGEVSPRLGGYTPGDAEFGFAIEKRVGAHLFSLTFANTSATTYGQLARGGAPQSLHLGFNLARKFF